MRLSQKWVDRLVNLPEMGMGYQVVDVILKNGSTVKGLMVVNCQDILVEVYFSEEDIADIVISDT